MSIERREAWPRLGFYALVAVWGGSVAVVGPLTARQPAGPAPGSGYVPPAGDVWSRKGPQEVGLDPTSIARAVAYGLANDSHAPTDLKTWMLGRLAGKPANEILGPMKSRGGPSGMILRHGYRVAEWGDPARVDMTFSVTKSFLATVAGVARTRGKLDDLDARVADAIGPVAGFDDPHNAPITWRQLLQQTSEWQGTLWDKPDRADRRRGYDRTIETPGTFWEYNDVRVNVASLALLHLLGEPLPTVLAEAVMQPIGASETWRWHGYRNSQITMGDTIIESVSGGGHWGGGLWISTRDLARFGLLFLRDGRWGERAILPPGWTEEVRRTTPLEPTYSHFFWINTDRALWPSAPASSYAARGGGDHLVWIDPEHDLVAVVRWIERGTQDGFLKLLLASLEAAPDATHQAADAPSFRDASDQLPPTVEGMTMDAKPVDVDLDGDLDLMLAMEHVANILLINDGTGRFTDQSTMRLPPTPHDSEDIAVADLDGDGDPDLVVVSEDDKVDEILLNDGSGHFHPGPRLPVEDETNAIESLDFDGDGNIDLLLGNKGQNRLLLGQGDGSFHDATKERLPALTDITQDVELGDVDGDGDADILVANHDRNRLLINDGHGYFSDQSAERLPLRRAPEESREADFGDVDGDGDLDVLFANIRGFVRDADPRNRLLINDGSGYFTDQTEARLPADTDRAFDADLIDLDGDGDLDVITANANATISNGQRQVVAMPYAGYRNDGTGHFAHDPSLLPASAVGKGFDVEPADFDGDGVLDLYLAGRGSHDRLLLHTMPGPRP